MSGEIEIPERSEREYFRAFGIVALFVAASPSRTPCLIGHTRDLGRSLTSIRSRWHWSVMITHAWWTAERANAKAIIAAVNRHFPFDSHGRFDAHVDAVANRLLVEARALNMRVTPHADAFRRVKLAAARIDGALNAANAAGELGWFNRAYQSWRLNSPVAVIPYARARTRLRAAMVRRIADGGATGPDLWSEVFPGFEAPGVPVETLSEGGSMSDGPSGLEAPAEALGPAWKGRRRARGA